MDESRLTGRTLGLRFGLLNVTRVLESELLLLDVSQEAGIHRGTNQIERFVWDSLQ